MTTSRSTLSLDELRAWIGRPGAPEPARDPVNLPMIRHWCDAMEDANPVYVDPGFAERSVHGRIVAPPAMLNVWTMRGLPGRTTAADDPMGQVLARLREAGFSSVVATNSEHEYLRYLHPGDTIAGTQAVTGVSPEKHTALGHGHFVSTVTDYRTGDGELVGRMKFVILLFKPGTGRARPGDGEKGSRPLRPRPGISRDTEFFWDGLKAGELRIQRCAACAALHHPPKVRCPGCGGYDFGYTVSSGRATLYSFVEPCYPVVPAFDYPYVVGLVELEEGTRLLTNIVDVDPDKVAVGMPLEVVFRAVDPELTLPMFRPRRPPRRATTFGFAAVAVGDELEPCPVPITTRLIVAGAIATRDYQDVHHDRDMAIVRGSPDIFMNILTTSGLCGRYVSDWAGPEALLRSLKIRLGAPNYPHDTMTLSGAVRSKKTEGDRNLVEVGLRGYNCLGDHVTGTVELELPGGGGVR